MLKPIIPETKIEQFRNLLSEANRIVITCHLSPDGDALGSTLAMREILLELGKQVYVVTPDAPPEYLMFIHGAEEVVVSKKYPDFAEKLFNEAELIICMDFNAAYRTDNLKDILLGAPARKVLIDHHIDPENFCDLVFSYPGECSTCMLTFRIIAQLGWMNLITRQVAENICTGMLTDTGNFTYSSQNPDIYIVLAELIRRGADKEKIYKLTYNTKSINQFRLEAYALANNLTIFPEKRAALITLSLDELNRFRYRPGDTEGLVNKPLAIPEVLYVAFLREGPDYIKVSCRSEGEMPVNKLCSEYYAGGGHKNAAGGEFKGSMTEAVELFHKAMDDFEKYLPQK